MENILFTG